VTRHPDLDPASVQALRESLGVQPPAPNGGHEPSPGRPPAAEPVLPTAARVKQRLKERARPAAAAMLDRVAARVLERVREPMRAELRAEFGDLAAQLDVLRAHVRAITPIVASLDQLARASDALHALRVNQELMKGEVSAFRTTLDEVGRAIAPTAGLEGVPARFAELRERVNAADRELRRLLSAEAAGLAPAAAQTAEAAETPEVAAAAAAAPGAFRGSGFDYVGFEGRFRGDPAAVLVELTSRYAELLASHQPVVDIGCGRGELLASLAARGIDGIGVEPDAGMAAEARGRGIDVHATGAVEFLSAAEPGSFGAITAIHVAEHLDLETLVTFVELAASRLRAGGVLVIETPNPASLVVLGNSYVMDPTHVWPLHPALTTFLCERAGFRDVELRFHSPAEAYHLPLLVESSDSPEWVHTVNTAFRRLNESLYGPQEYAAIATTAPVGPSDS
jgi:2-polyprenyl-3-methyl-5-hydroxy-6-metoxy-1,4-benzoquinol methylase